MRIKFCIVLLVVSATFAISFKTYSQATISADTIKSNLLKDWERAKAYTQDYMKAMPANKFSFRASDSVRTFAQQLLHLAEANMFFSSTATGAQMPAIAADLEKENQLKAQIQ